MRSNLLVFFVLLLVLVSGCQGPEIKPNDEVVEIDFEGSDSVETVTGISSLSLDEFYVEATSTLEDTTDIGFNYEAAMVLDKDFSTAWCPSAPLNESITVHFPLVAGEGVFGIVTGFARDEAIFFQNNRLKTLDAEYFEDGISVYKAVLEFQDSYSMQFAELPKLSFDSIAFTISSVYEGSKFKDSCIAEMDFLSDYVTQKDSDAALTYYLENKSADALKPYDIVGAAYSMDEGNGTGTVCGDSWSPPSFVNEDYLDLFQKNYAIASINQYGSLGDELIVKWYYSGVVSFFDDNGQEIEQYYDWRLIRTSLVEVLQGCKGEFYAFDMLDSDFISKNKFYFVNPPGGAVHGSYLAEFWFKGKKVGSVEYQGMGF